MSDLKGTINYLRAMRDICNNYSGCQDCKLGADNCPFYEPPLCWTDAHILSMITYAELAQKEGE